MKLVYEMSPRLSVVWNTILICIRVWNSLVSEFCCFSQISPCQQHGCGGSLLFLRRLFWPVNKAGCQDSELLGLGENLRMPWHVGFCQLSVCKTQTVFTCGSLKVLFLFTSGGEAYRRGNITAVSLIFQLVPKSLISVIFAAVCILSFSSGHRLFSCFSRTAGVTFSLHPELLFCHLLQSCHFLNLSVIFCLWFKLCIRLRLRRLTVLITSNSSCCKQSEMPFSGILLYLTLLSSVPRSWMKSTINLKLVTKPVSDD